MKFVPLTQEIFDYCQNQNPVIHNELAELRSVTARHPYSQMQISHEQGAFLRFLAGAIQAKHILEIGCFTGYSAICMASALPAKGKLITLDVDPEATSIAKEYFQKTGMASRIELRIGKATDSLKKMLNCEGAAFFDMAFIDADKSGMPEYLEHCLNLVRVGGLIICDNVLWSGSVTDPGNQKKDTVAIRQFNEMVKNDARVEKCFVNIADGLYILRRL